LRKFNANYCNDYMNIVRNHNGDTVKSHIVNDFTIIIPKRMLGGIITNSENIQN